MRLAPVPIATYLDLELTYKMSAASSITTHPNLGCIEACAAHGTLITGALQGWTKEATISFGQELSSRVNSAEVSAVLSGYYLDKTRDQISSSGYVVHTLEAALWASACTDDFKEGALLAVNLADDADTVGAVYGQLAGAHYGETGIPSDWIGHLDQSAMITAMADQLHDIAGTLSVSTESSPHLNIIQPDSALFGAHPHGSA
ncbi:ADP-ribosylglycohydrolase family protein [Jonesiaceae bacterium BS-20]|uniref:ADP-ribosylglycohydrolase family protein n=1 Tax=Jonesiaceae bacterium BS-20 TaxID=3120821 RepID=A0AAU7DSJ5_9MICO